MFDFDFHADELTEPFGGRPSSLGTVDVGRECDPTQPEDNDRDTENPQNDFTGPFHIALPSTMMEPPSQCKWRAENGPDLLPVRIRLIGEQGTFPISWNRFF